MYLHSRPVSTTAYSKKTRLQEVSVWFGANYDTVWEVEHEDPKMRFEVRGKPVPANEPVVIKHCPTS